tara:strand:+ start:433 stop:696 length:264 start_codon:yes stop_codon:yes gene_type:complete
MANANKYPSGRTGGWNLKNPINKLDATRRGDPTIRKQVEPVEENSIGDTDMQPMVKHGLIDNIKGKKWIVLGLVAVAGFFAYKKFKK